MFQILENINSLYLAVIFLAGLISFSISTISGGGGALMLIPFLNFIVGTTKTAPIINLGAFISRPSRIIIFWKNIVWKVFWYYVPSAMLGAVIAAYFFSSFKIAWLQVIVALFLISTFFQYRFGKKERSFSVQLWYFIPLGFLVSIVGTFTGGMGPVLNPFYLNAGITKEELIGTKAANSFFLGIAQISSYTFFGLLTTELWIYGITLGIGATIGNLIGKKLLSKIKNSTFRKLVIIIMVISGILLLIRAVSSIV
ncbi:MAG: sulfite exporter TauE/SafE family protein [Flavobacteriaceae bacterium]|nr:sulfite exporter TauE/SafE family protein [Flavobacteriaceae bacterium]